MDSIIEKNVTVTLRLEYIDICNIIKDGAVMVNLDSSLIFERDEYGLDEPPASVQLLVRVNESARKDLHFIRVYIENKENSAPSKTT
jgi:hypothetical protein